MQVNKMPPKMHICSAHVKFSLEFESRQSLGGQYWCSASVCVIPQQAPCLHNNKQYVIANHHIQVILNNNNSTTFLTPPHTSIFPRQPLFPCFEVFGLDFADFFDFEGWQSDFFHQSTDVKFTAY